MGSPNLENGAVVLQGGEGFMTSIADLQPQQPIADSQPQQSMDIRQWFVAIDDMDVGPIDISEFESRWRMGEIQPASLAWRPGMVQWQPISALSELRYLLQQIPRAEPKQSSAVINWVNNNAVSLSALVEMEFDGESTKAPLPVTHFSAPEVSDGLPDLAALGFAGGGAVPPFGFAGVSSQNSGWTHSWSVPPPTSFQITPWQEDDAGRNRLVVGLIVAGFVVLGAGFAWTMTEWVRGARQTPTLAVKAALSERPAATSPAPTPTPASAPAQVTAQAEPVKIAARVARKPSTAKAQPVRASTKTRSMPRKTNPKRETTSSANRVLTKLDIKTGIKANAPSLMSCLKAARSRGEVPAGKIRLVLDWTINADGSVAQAKLKGPSQISGTSLPACTAAQMRSWRFPASSRPSTVSNFGLPVNLR